MTPTEALAKLEADFAPAAAAYDLDGDCEVPGAVFDALLAIAKAAIERDAAQYERNNTPVVVDSTDEYENRSRYWAEVDRRTARVDAAEATYAAALTALSEAVS